LKPFIRFAVLVAVGGALATSAAQAQSQYQGQSQSQGQGQYGQQQPDLHALLHIRPDQEAVFHAYQTAAPLPQEMQALQMNPQSLATMTTPQRLDRIGGMLNAQMAVFHRKAEAARALYAQLSPDQRRAFDQATSPPQGRGGPPQR
jgi:hypothetical protein